MFFGTNIGTCVLYTGAYYTPRNTVLFSYSISQWNNNQDLNFIFNRYIIELYVLFAATKCVGVMSDMVNCLVKLRIAIAKKWAQHKTEKLEALVQVCSYIITVLTIFMSPNLYTEVRTCWFTSAQCVCRVLCRLDRGGRPSKHERLTQCWANVGPLSTTLSQH